MPPSEPSPVLYIIACGGRPAQFGHTIRVDRPADAGPVERDVAAIAGRLVASARARGLTWAAQASPVPEAGDVGIIQRADGRKEQSFHLIDGVVFQVRDGELIPSGKQGKELAELTSLIRLRDAAVDLLDAEADHGRGDESLVPLRSRLNTAYDRYVAAYGPLNRATISSGEPDPETGIATVTRRRPRMGGFRQDRTTSPSWRWRTTTTRPATPPRPRSSPSGSTARRAGRPAPAAIAPVIAAMPSRDVARQVARLAQRLGLDHATVTEAVTDALTQLISGRNQARTSSLDFPASARRNAAEVTMPVAHPASRRAAPGTHQAGLRTGRIPR